MNMARKWILMGAGAVLLPPATWAQPPAPPTPPKAPAARAFVWAKPAGSYLGVGVKEIEAERARELGLKDEHGVEVTSVAEDGPAAKAGVQVGDVFLEYNGQRIEGWEQLGRMLRETPAGRTVRLTVWRNGGRQTLSVTTAQRRSTIKMSDPGFPIEVPWFDVPKAFMTWRSSTLGIEAEALESQLADFFGVKEGVLVRSVLKDSAAERAGIKAGDVITKVENQKVATPREVTRAVRAARASRSFPISIVRERREIVLTVTLPEER